MTEKFIKKFEIEIGSSMWDRSNPLMYFLINDRVVHIELKELRKMIDTIIESKGDRSPKAYKAFERLKDVFYTLLHPYIDRKLEERPNEH